MTSKLINSDTYGYRGEALACITYISNVTIISRTRDSDIAYKVKFADGKPQGAPSPVASTVGTTVVVENLFGNMARKRSMREQEEYRKIVSLVADYAIHNATVSFTLRKNGTAGCDIKTERGSTVRKNIGKILTEKVASQLKGIQLSSDQPPFAMEGYMSTSTFTGKKSKFILFVNDRLIEHQGIRRMVERIYEEYLPRLSFFVYIDLKVAHDRIDCNVNPSKTAVRLLEEEKLVQQLEKFFTECVGGCSQVKAFSTTQPPVQQSQRFAVRVDAKTPSIRSFLEEDGRTVLQNTQGVDRSAGTNADGEPAELPKRPHPTLADVEERRKERKRQGKPTSRAPRVFTGSELGSIQSIVHKFEVEGADEDLKKVVSELVYVGSISTSYMLLQSMTRLYLVHIPTVVGDLAFQQSVYNMGRLNSITLEPQLSIQELLELSGVNRDTAINQASAIAAHALLLLDYFSISVTDGGMIAAIPDVLPGYVPSIAALPFFMKSLGEVNWQLEEDCLNGIARAIGVLYSLLPADTSDEETNKIIDRRILPYIRSKLIPQRGYNEKILIPVADIATLYKAFERC